MKKLLLIGVLFVLCLPNAFARKRVEKAGKVKDQVYTDKKYSFKLTFSKGWKYKIKANKDHYRAVLVQKNYQIPPDYLEAEDYTQVPRLVIWADTSTLGAFAFLDSLLSDTYKSKQKKDIYKEFDIINKASAGSGTYREKLVPKGRRAITITGKKGVRWTGYVKYMKEVALSAASADEGGKRVRGAYGGSIVAIKKGDMIIMFHMMCEWLYFPQVEAEILKMINSIEWVEPEKKEK